MASRSKFRALTIGKHDLFALGLRHILKTDFGFDEVSNLYWYEEAVDYFQKGGEAELVFLDISLLRLPGTNLTACLRSYAPNVRMVLMLPENAADYPVSNQLHGPVTWLNKGSSLDEVRQVILSVLDGQLCLPKTEIGYLTTAGESAIKNVCRKYRLSGSEERILDKLLEQKNYKEVASELYLSPQTVRTHKKNIYRKLSVRNMAGIVGLLAEDLPK